MEQFVFDSLLFVGHCGASYYKFSAPRAAQNGLRGILYLSCEFYIKAPAIILKVVLMCVSLVPKFVKFVCGLLLALVLSAMVTKIEQKTIFGLVDYVVLLQLAAAHKHFFQSTNSESPHMPFRSDWPLFPLSMERGAIRSFFALFPSDQSEVQPEIIQERRGRGRGTARSRPHALFSTS
jgi:hypothetical protein